MRQGEKAGADVKAEVVFPSVPPVFPEEHFRETELAIGEWQEDLQDNDFCLLSPLV